MKPDAVRLTTVAVVVAAARAVAVPDPLFAQEALAARPPARVRPYVAVEIGVGSARLRCGPTCGYSTTGVSRALSFLGLGLVLVPIGWLYQKILFRRQALPAGPQAEA